MRIEQLEYLAAVTHHGSLRQASEKLHVSQPALSEALGKLERELGVTLLDRRRSGARISPQGQELLPAMTDVLDAVDRLRRAAGDPGLSMRMLRVGTVNAGTSSLLVPAIRSFRADKPETLVEVLNSQQPQILQGLREGGLDLGLVNLLPGDDTPPDLTATPLVRGRPVVCCRTDHRFAGQETVSVDDLRDEPFVAMRSGYLMHRYAHRLFDSRLPTTTYSTDGAEMGKLLVAEGLGVTILPSYSIDGDPMMTQGMITHRPIDGDEETVTLVLLHRSVRPSAAVEGLAAALVRRAREYAAG